MKTYSVEYSTTTRYDAVVKAGNKAEAINKVKEVIGESVVIESAWEIKNEAN